MSDDANTTPVRRRPEAVSDDTVRVLGKLSESLETVEHARGHLYSFQQLTGHADALLQDAVDQLEEAGHMSVANELRWDRVGRNVLPGRWTFQVVEEYDAGYWSRFRSQERRARELLADGVHHLWEAQTRENERTPDRPGHERTPDDLE